MSAQIINFFDYGQKLHDREGTGIITAEVVALPVVRTEIFSDDVYYMSPPLQRPSDTEPTD